MREDGDHCSVCRAPFKHNSRTYGGTTKVGKSALTGECCQGKIEQLVLGGIYLDGEVDDLVSRLPTNSRGSASSSVNIEPAVNAIQQVFAQRQAQVQAAARRAGVTGGKAKLFTQDSAWKTEDAAWFEAHPSRSHRLRSLVGDEAAASGFATDKPMPVRHEMQVLVRQIEPGKRMRLPFGRNLDVPIPDDETVLHALFDIVGGEGDEGTVISAEMMLKAMERYNGSNSFAS